MLVAREGGGREGKRGGMQQKDRNIFSKETGEGKGHAYSNIGASPREHRKGEKKKKAVEKWRTVPSSGSMETTSVDGRKGVWSGQENSCRRTRKRQMAPRSVRPEKKPWERKKGGAKQAGLVKTTERLEKKLV